jgi:hypothetical protein
VPASPEGLNSRNSLSAFFNYNIKGKKKEEEEEEERREKKKTIIQ